VRVLLKLKRAVVLCVMQWKNKPVSELKSTAGGGGPIVSVNTHTRALFAFIQMHTQGVSAVAVVDSQGILVGSISVSDLRSLTPTQLESLQLPVMEFLAQRHTNAPSTPISCSATATVGEAVELLAAARVHRVWVVVRARCVPWHTTHT
jgi:CBS domain-containing protein